MVTAMRETLDEIAGIQRAWSSAPLAERIAVC